MRRFPKALVAGVALLAAPATALLGSAAASADPAVVTATIFSGGAAGVATQTVTGGELARCPTADPSPFILNPSGISYQPAAGSAWSLATIVSCGLQIPPGSLTDVAVRSARHGFEDPLSPQDLTEATRYQDPTAPQALPVISVDGGQNQVTYARPERSASDANATDEVVATGPVTIAVYENAPPLHVRIAARQISTSATTLREQFTAAVTDASGAAIPGAALGVSWSFEDGGSSATPSPTHTFPAGRWFVTVVAIDHAAGTGGTATTSVGSDSPALAGPTDQRGAGGNRRAVSPSGAVHGGSRAPSVGHASPHARTPRRARPAHSPPSTGSASSPLAATPSPATSAAPPIPAARPHHVATGHRPRVMRSHSPTGGRVVRGLLIADVTPIAPAASRPAGAASSAPVVRAATRDTTLSAPIAVALLAALLVLGAARELRGRRRWRGLRLGS